jgi:hypothetical protein
MERLRKLEVGSCIMKSIDDLRFLALLSEDVLRMLANISQMVSLLTYAQTLCKV